MLLLVRFLLTMLRGFLLPKLGPLDTSVVRYTVLPTDCDLNLHLNGGRYLSFMDIARVELIARSGIFRRMLQRRWRPMMGGAIIRFRRSVQPFERFDLRTRLVGWDEKWFYLEQVVEKGQGTFCAIGHARVAVVSKNGTVTPAEVLALIGHDAPSPLLPEIVRDWKTLEERR